MSRFDPVTFEKDIKARYDEVREGFKNLEVLITKNLPDRGFHRDRAITHLEDAYMRFGKAFRKEQVKRNKDKNDIKS